MIQELDCVALSADLPESGLKRGDLGAVVLVHDGGQAFEVEFVDLGGQTLAVLTLEPSQIRPVTRGEVANARSVQSA